MSIIESVLSGINFIEARLLEKINVVDVSNHANYSQFYYSRQFSKTTCISIYDYIMHRKFTESYKDLLSTNHKVIDIAYKYGFSSHEVFTRGFKKKFGINPSEAVDSNHLLLFDKIDYDYLMYLSTIKVELFDSNLDTYYFVGKPTNSLLNTNNNVLIVLNTLYNQIDFIMNGNLLTSKQSLLSYNLGMLRLKLRLYNSNIEYAIRFYLNNYYEITQMRNNFIVVINNDKYVDICIAN
ncbi:helix-turn-helix transcriptional regulator [Clostridiaceae bacterium M8S5]|nr:helix-turn-helix transcriptional regulator [Clostridiaceae bacterium M8S5]